MTHLEILSKLKHGTLTVEEMPEAYQVIKDRLFELMELALDVKGGRSPAV